ncbi:MAG: 16S rRNA (guanine(966)-N(2))-methyltransferase RsmD [Desulfuromonadaceae bacterium]|nr:16S rRNA (guanine(966)-N(2))-methyltransferase RsmD [Desulfuromonadaceae bacterium]
MRIISGSAKGRQLKTFSGQTIRPTSDRVREALFSILSSQLGGPAAFNGLSVLDIFAGSGALGLEALSRGAARAVFVDQGKQAQKLILDNARLCRLESQCRVISRPAKEAITELAGQQFDLIFLDPPYGQGLLPQVIEKISAASLLASAGLICAEERRGEAVPEQIGRYSCLDQRHYGQTSIYLYHHSNGELNP